MKRVAGLVVGIIIYILACILIGVIGIIIYILACILIGVIGAPARAHDWYPIECCHSMDCAPIDKFERDGADFIVTTKHGTARVPQSMPRRESKDHRSHACIRPDESGTARAICIFLPPAI